MMVAAKPTEYFWLVSHSAGASEVVKLPKGQTPLGAHGVRFLGSTIPEVERYLAQASKELGAPDPRNVPSLATSIGIGTAIVGGAAAGLGGAAVEAATAGESATAASAGAATAEGAAGGGAAATAKDAASKAASSASGGLTKDLLAGGLAVGVAELVKAYGVRILEIVAGGALIVFALMTLARGGEAPAVLPVPV